METGMTRREFEFARYHTRRSFWLASGFVFFWLICLASAFLIDDESVKTVLLLIFGPAGLVCFFLRLSDYWRTVKLTVEDHALRFESAELKPEEIDRIELSYGILTIRRKDRGWWAHLHLPLKKPEDAELLKEHLAAFASRHSIRFNIGR